MVAIINTSKSLRNALQYNENKLTKGMADLIHSKNFVKDTEDLGFTDKWKTLQRLAQLNQRTKVNSVHISLNFDPSEKLSPTTLQKIANTYMERIGFGNQPYLVYQHLDAGHPHLHVVTTNIQRDGSRIPLHNIGKNQSEKARKEIESEFKLVKAERLKEQQTNQALNVQKVLYGKSDTRRSITNVLNAVLPHYKYTSLAELNAVLKAYNILADRGREESNTYQKKGLVYRVLNEQGEKVGVPIKSSSIYTKPGLKYLENQFAINTSLRLPHKQRVRNSVDMALLKKTTTLDQLANALRKEGIHLILRQNASGLVYGITYVDHTTKCIFNGSDLGKPYSANAIRERFAPKQVSLEPIQQSLSPTSTKEAPTLPGDKLAEIVTQLISPEENSQWIVSELKEDLRKKKRKRLRH